MVIDHIKRKGSSDGDMGRLTLGYSSLAGMNFNVPLAHRIPTRASCPPHKRSRRTPATWQV